MPTTRSTLHVYNTADRLLHGDLFHTVTIADVLGDLTGYPADYPTVGIGTTAWMRRNGEVICDGTTGAPKFLWADPESRPVGQIIDLGSQYPSPNGTELVTPRMDDDDQQASFPFLAIAVGDPSRTLIWNPTGINDLHAWLIDELKRANVDAAGVQIRGQLNHVNTTDAYNIPLTGLDLSLGYQGDEFFRKGEYQSSEWIINGVFAANPSIQPFISVTGHPLHLHGYRPQQQDGGHIVRAALTRASATIWVLDDLVLRIHDVGRAITIA